MCVSSHVGQLDHLLLLKMSAVQLAKTCVQKSFTLVSLERGEPWGGGGSQGGGGPAVSQKKIRKK